jgi:sortase A
MPGTSTDITRRGARHALRFVAHVLIVSGLLLICDAAVTFAWQEPISAFTAGREQATLERELEDPPARVVRKEPLKGDAIGKIELPTLDESYYVVEGTDTDSLRKGPGHYPETALPGERGTVAIAGHRTTHGAPFRNVDKLSRGDRIVVEMPYGTFVYRVQKTQIVDPTDTWVTDSVGYRRLVLSACHPLYSAAQRIIVFARQVGGKRPSALRAAKPSR